MKKLVMSFVILCLALSLASCESTATPTTLPPPATSAPTTEAPTTTIETTAPVAIPLTAEEVLIKLQEAGLPLTNIVVYDEKTDPNEKLGRPGSYTSKANFSDPAHEDSDLANPDNTIEVFTSEEEALARAEYVKSVTAGTMMEQYIYQVGVYVLRLDFDVLPSDAAKYEEAFTSVVSK